MKPLDGHSGRHPPVWQLASFRHAVWGPSSRRPPCTRGRGVLVAFSCAIRTGSRFQDSGCLPRSVWPLVRWPLPPHGMQQGRRSLTRSFREAAIAWVSSWLPDCGAALGARPSLGGILLVWRGSERSEVNLSPQSVSWDLAQPQPSAWAITRAHRTPASGPCPIPGEGVWPEGVGQELRAACGQRWRGHALAATLEPSAFRGTVHLQQSHPIPAPQDNFCPFAAWT